MSAKIVSNRTALLGKRILIAEDEVIIALMLESDVHDAGGAVIGPAFDLVSAIALATEPAESIDAAVLDINLRGEKSFPAARLLRARGVPVVFASANCGDLDFIGDEFSDCLRLEKPISTGMMIETLRGLTVTVTKQED